MEFIEFKTILQNHFAEMTNDVSHLFEVEVDKDKFWNLYLDSFPSGKNNVFRERREYDCSCCRHFIKNFGNVVTIKNNEIHTIWDLVLDDDVCQPVVDALSAYIKSRPVSNVYVGKFKKIGTDHNHEQLADGKVIKWEHFYVELPDRFVDKTSRSVGDLQGDFRDTRNVFKRSMDEISEESVLTVLELISQNSLYKGEEWKSVLEKFLDYKRKYDLLNSDSEKENFAWENSVVAGSVVGRIRNHSIGTLLVNISEGMELDTAVGKYETIVAPTNYKRPKAIYTKKMLEEAKKTITELGYLDSLARRFATLDDISVNNILFSNKDASQRIRGQRATLDIFDDMANEISIDVKKFSKVDEISISDFVENVLPQAKELEVFFENRHAPNMVSLIAPKNPEAKTMFKWDNGFSWAYAGNVTDSIIKENVKSAGGKIDGDLRFSIQWNDEEDNFNDFDAHCLESNNKYEIFFGNRNVMSPNGGRLDVDIINPRHGYAAVENIVYASKSRMQSGVYQFFVQCYLNRGGKSGFKAEIEFDGTIYSFMYNKPMRTGETVRVADVTLKNGIFSIEEQLPSSTSTREIWKLHTNSFVPVSVIMYSPNYWDEQSGIGHRHYFFMLKNCENSETPNGFYNEFLKNDLIQHKRVFEALGSKMAVETVEDQLSGIGFSSTKHNDILVKVKGASERVLRVKF